MAGNPVPAETSGDGPSPDATFSAWAAAVTDLLPDLVAVVDSRGLLLYANAAAGAVLGYAPATELGRSMFELVHPEDLDSVTASFLETVATPGPAPLTTFRMRGAEGDWRHVETTATNCLADPSVAGVVVNLRDVTDRVRAEVRADRLTRLYRVLALSREAAAGAANAGLMYKRMCDLAVMEGGFRLAWVGLLEHGEVVPVAIAGEPAEYVESLRLSLDDARLGPTVSAIIGGRPATAFTADDSLLAPWRAPFVAAGFASSCAVPIGQPDAVIGALSVYSSSTEYFDDEEVALLVDLASDLASGRDRLEVEEEREALNRRLQDAVDLLQGATDSMSEGMFVLDLDGRATLVNSAAAALLGVTPEDLIGEPMHDLTHYERADGSPLPVEDCPIHSAGSHDEVVRIDRDLFMRLDGTRLPVSYVASPLHASGDGIRGCVVVFRDITAELAEERRVTEALEKVSWIGRIKDAMDEDRLVLFAQPIFDLASGAVMKHELLLRLKTREGDFVLPGMFLPAAEEFGLIKQIDHWVIGEACAIAAEGHSVSFNLSGLSLDDPATLDAVVAALDATGAPPENLTCEITETALMRSGASAEQLVRSIRALGLGIALDDFGVGFGGFAYLKALPITTVKVDRQFVADAIEDPASKHVIQAIVSLARAFDLETVAEGAESTESVDLLRALGVDAVQGFVIGHPAPAHDVFHRAAAIRK